MGKVKKSYSKFQYADLWDLGLRTEIKSLFDAKNLKKVAPSDWLLQTLEIHRPISLATEKAKSEFIITPILAELRSRNASIFAIYSGFNFNIDEQIKAGVHGIIICGSLGENGTLSKEEKLTLKFIL